MGNEKLLPTPKGDTLLVSYSPKNFQKEILLNIRELGSNYQKALIRQFIFSSEKTKVLLVLSKPAHQYLLYDLTDKKATSFVIPKRRIRKLAFSPDGKSLGFIHNSNLYAYGFTTEEVVQLTTIDPNNNTDYHRWSWCPNSLWQVMAEIHL